MNELICLKREERLGTILKITLLSLLLMQGASFAWANNPLGQVKISIERKSVKIKVVLKDIEKQCDLRFFYNPQRVDVTRKVTVDFHYEPLEEVLDKIFEGTTTRYKFRGRQVLLFPENKSEETSLGIASPENIKKVLPAVLKEVSGVVTDEKNQPLVGVNVAEKGTSNGVTTDSSGEYKLEVNDESSILVFSSIGYITQEIPVGQRAMINVTLAEDVKNLDEVVVVGYGKQKKTELTGAVATVKGENINANASGNVTSGLQGRIAGVSVESNGGAPGAGLSITVRGASSLGVTSPLVVIDGVPFGSLDGINPSDVESITFLKDAAAACIYGSRASNGIVIVTTKSGKKNQTPTIQVNTVYGVQSIPKRMKMLNGEEWTTLFNTNGGVLPPYNGIDTNWQQEIFRAAPIFKTNMDISGGMEHFNYSISGAVIRQQGTVIQTDYTSANFRVKTQFEKGRFTFGETLIYNKGLNRSLPDGEDQAHSVIISALILPPTVPVRDPGNNLGGWGRRTAGMKNIANPVADLNSHKNTANNYSLVTDAFMDVQLIDRLKYKLNVGYSESRNFGSNYIEAVDDGNLILKLSKLSQSSYFSSSWLIENLLSWDKKIQKHEVAVLAGYTAQRDSSAGFGAEGFGLPKGLQTLSNATTFSAPSGWSNTTKRTSLLARLNYTFDSRYLLSFSIRQDGSSKFSEGYRYGLFPAVSIGWNMHNENFFTPIQSKGIQVLKIRGSYGVLGNDQIADYSTSNGISSNLNFLTNSGMVLGLIPSGTASPPNLRWEQTETIDIGFDAAFLKNRLSFSFDWFEKTSKGILLKVPVPNSAGISDSPYVNAGVVKNRGIEITTNFSDKIGDVTYGVGFNVTSINNKMTNITIGSGNQEFGDITRAKVGSPLGGFYLIKTNGIFKSQSEIDAYIVNGKKVQPNAAPGDIKFVDYNQDGVIDNNDQQYCGSPIPNLETGITGMVSWKNFDFNVLFQGIFGNKIYNGTRIWTEKMTEYINYSTTTLNAWTPNNSNSDFPRFVISDPNLNARANSDRWLENGSYLRLRRLEIGYRLPQEWLMNKLKIQSFRAYLFCENLLTFSKYKGFNPDLGNGGNPLNRGVDGGSYPLQRTISLGVTVSF